MNDMRERLIQLICDGTAKTETCDLRDDCATAKGDCGFCTIMADHLLANGVTIQEWISVEDRLPEGECRCLVIDGCDDIEMDVYDGKGKFVLDHISAVQHPKFWTPLPQPPKGE